MSHDSFFHYAHPRLLASADDWLKIQLQVESDLVSARIWQCLNVKADQFLRSPEAAYLIDGRRMLAQSRLCLEHILTLATAARITGDERYAKRAIREMRSVANFPNWNPKHFLDVAEMCSALAIGYDWLHDYLDADDRKVIETALWSKGLRPSFDGSPDELWWVGGTNNWNQVCHAALSLAAIALIDIYPELAEQTLKRAIENISKAAHSYAPDGAYAEGPVYWGYGTSYHVLLTAALEHFRGETSGLDQFAGFEKSGEFMIEMTSPSGSLFNYSDSEARRLLEVPLFWFARRFQRPDLVRYELEHIEPLLSAYEKAAFDDGFRFLSLALIWHKPETAIDPNRTLPLNWFGRGANPVAVFRSAWGDPNALFAGIKGGCARDPHAHMDAGSFVLESDGVRWAIDLDKQDYASLERAGLRLWGTEQNADRWKIFRLNSDGHNVLCFNGASQRADGRAEFVHVETSGGRLQAIVNLDSIYSDQVASARRGLAFQGRSVLIQDEWQATMSEVKAEWRMLTRADVTLGDRKLILVQDGKKLVLHLLGPETIHVEVRDASKPVQPYDAPNPGLRQIVLRTTTPAGQRGMFRILAVPDRNASALEIPPVVSLDQWPVASVSRAQSEAR